MANTKEVNQHDNFLHGSPIIDSARYEHLKSFLRRNHECTTIVTLEEVREIFSPVVSPFGMQVSSCLDQFEQWLNSEGYLFIKEGFHYLVKSK